MQNSVLSDFIPRGGFPLITGYSQLKIIFLQNSNKSCFCSKDFKGLNLITDLCDQAECEVLCMCDFDKQNFFLGGREKNLINFYKLSDYFLFVKSKRLDEAPTAGANALALGRHCFW